MDTQNKELLNKEKNRQYYQKSDGNFMPIERAFKAHLHLDRIKWVRDWVHKLGSRAHIDVATKDGYLPLTLAAEGIDCIGIDPSEDALDEARLRAFEAGLDIKFIQGYLEDVELIKELTNEKGEVKKRLQLYADTVSALEVLEHVIDPDSFVNKLSQMGSYVFLSTPDANGRHGLRDAKRNPEHVRVFTLEELSTLAHKYGDIIEAVVRDDQLCVLMRPSGL